MKLKFADDLALPVDVVTQRGAMSLLLGLAILFALLVAWDLVRMMRQDDKAHRDKCCCHD